MRKIQNDTIINFVYFCANYNFDFVEKAFESLGPNMVKRFQEKARMLYNRKGTAWVPFFFLELDRENQRILANYINENYKSWTDLSLNPEKKFLLFGIDACQSLLHNGFEKLIEEIKNERIDNYDFMSHVVGESVTEILSKTESFGEYSYITEEQYNKLSEF